MNNILYIGPEVQGRYQGGIMNIFLTFKIAKKNYVLNCDDYNFQLFNSHTLKQTSNSEGKFKFENIRQSIYLLFRLIVKLSTNDYKIIHFNSSASWPMLKDLILLNLAKWTSKNSIILFHIHFCGIDEVFVKNRFLRKIQIFLLKKTEVIVLSNTFKNELISLNFKKNKVHFLPNFHNRIIDITKNKLDTSHAFNLLFIGSISLRKGFLDLLYSLNQLNIKYVLNVMGEFENDNIKNQCHDYVEKNNLNVIFHGYKVGQEKDDIIRKSKILILPSYAEGFPLVIPEALSFGLVVVSTYISAIPEIIENNNNGFLFKPGDTLKLKNILEKLYYNRELLNQISLESFNSSKKYTFKNHVFELKNIYNNILNYHE
jgi:glycosyltransferase involved in cell wall biosynthesis